MPEQDVVGSGGPPPADGPPEIVTRVVYASRANVTGSVYAEMESIRAAAVRHNVPLDVHTALLYQSGWFVQWKEGPAEALSHLMNRVETDARHYSLVLVHLSRGPRLLSGPWSMAIVQCDDTPEDMSQRVAQLQQAMKEGRQYAPPAVWRQISTPMRHPGAAQQAHPDAFQRVLVCAAAGSQSFELVQWLSREHRQPVVHRRFAGAMDLDVGTDFVDFMDDDRVMRVIAMARKGLALPLTRAFVPDYSHVVLLLSGESEWDASLMRKVANACSGLSTPPVLLGVAEKPEAHQEPFALAHRLGMIYLDAQADPNDPESVWAAVHPLFERWREAANSGLLPHPNTNAVRA